jgi:hypothetical protein
MLHLGKVRRASADGAMAGDLGSCTAPRIGYFRSNPPRQGQVPALIADCTLVPVEGGPHNIGWTYPDEVNSALLTFLGEAG